MTIQEKLAEKKYVAGGEKDNSLIKTTDKKLMAGRILKSSLIGGATGSLLSPKHRVKGALIGAGLLGGLRTGRELVRQGKEEKKEQSEKKASFVEKNELITKAAADQGLTYDQFIYRLGLATAEKFIDDAR